MSISDTDIKKEHKTSVIYIIVTVLCTAVNLIYYQFGHGVSSDHMKYMFLIPFLSGTCLFELMAALKLPALPRLSFNLHNSSVAAVTTGELVHGICEIAGTSASFEAVYFVSALLMEISAAVFYIRSVIMKRSG
ncbi:MAG: hypothetical protein Q4F95_06820 [Oscillospiraceae bacterium]|nr:hypothetical protein [Oscillospiraceae bacterium]